MLDQILQIDQDLFLFLNSFHSSFWDEVMYLVSHKFFWIPFYAFLLYLLIKTYGWKTGLILGITVVACFAITNTVSTEVFKKGIQRLRPTHTPQIQDLVHVVHNHRGGYYGFFSSHASNVFGLAVLIGLYLKPKIKYMLLLLILWAAIISYSRIYLGVHYPLDIICGALFGSLIGYFTFLASKKFILSKKERN